MALEIIDLYINQSTEGREFLTKVVKLSNYKTINKIWVEAILSAPTGILSQGWAINEIRINNKGKKHVFGQSVISKFYDSRGGGESPITIGESNIVKVGWLAPFGAGVISPHANITIKLRIEGEKTIPFIDSEIETALDVNNIKETIDSIADKSTLPLIGLGIGLIVLVIIAIIFLPRILLALSVGQALQE